MRTGNLIETETDELSRDGKTYTGNNETKFYYLDGTQSPGGSRHIGDAHLALKFDCDWSGSRIP
jgi:hypothetical protein